MAFDTIVKANLATGETTELKLPPLKDEIARATAADNAFYATYRPREIGTPLPWSQRPRERHHLGRQFLERHPWPRRGQDLADDAHSAAQHVHQSALCGDSRQASERVDAAVDH